MAPDKSTGAKPADPRTAGKQSGAEKTTPARRTTAEKTAPKPPAVADTTSTAETAPVTTEAPDTASDPDLERSDSPPPSGVQRVVATVAERVEPPPGRGRVSLVTLQQGVLHRQRATGVAELQAALGLSPTGQPDDALDGAVAKFREDEDLGVGSVDSELLRRLGFDVVLD